MKFGKNYSRFTQALETLFTGRDSLTEETLTTEERGLLQTAKQLMQARYEAKPHRPEFKDALLDRILASQEEKVKAGRSLNNPFKNTLFVGLMMAGAVAALLLAVFAGKPDIGNIFQPHALQGIVIPAALAQDNFTLDAETKDIRGIVGVNSSFILTSKQEITKADVERYLTIGEGRTFTVTELEAGHSFRVDPLDDFSAGELIQVRVATLIPSGDAQDQYQPYEIQWVFEIADHFKVSSSVPADHSQSVPTSTAVKITFSHVVSDDVANAITVSPAHAYKVETGYKTVSIVPTKPWATDTIYTITIKKGFGVDQDLIPVGADRSQWQLPQDYTISFATSGTNQAQTASLYNTETMYYSQPGKSTVVSGYFYQMTRPETAKIELYKLDGASAREKILGFQGLPTWAPTALYNKAQQAYVSAWKLSAPAATLQAKNEGESYEYRFNVPAQQPGVYLGKLTANGISTYFFYSTSDIALYTGATSQDGLVWVVDLVATQPLPDADVYLNDRRLGKTNRDGLFKLGADEIESLRDVDVIEAVKNDRRVLMPVRVWGAPLNVYPTYHSFLHLDQYLVHPDDTVRFWGNMIGKPLPENVDVKVTWWDPLNYTTVTIDHQVVPVDAHGFLQGQSALHALKDGYYNLTVINEDQQIASAFFQVKKFTTPEISLQLTPAFLRIDAGETNTISISTTFFDGTPAAHVKLRLQGERTQEIETDDQGQASVRMPSQAQDCGSELDSYVIGCADHYEQLTATAVGAYETEITSSVYWQVTNRYLDIGIDMQSRTESELRVGGTVQNLSFATKNKVYLDTSDIIKTPAAGADVTAYIYEIGVEQSPLRQEYQSYTNENRFYYDFTQTKTLIDTRAFKTNADGSYDFTIQKQPNKNYRVVVRATDKLGRYDYREQSFAEFYFPYRQYVTDPNEPIVFSRGTYSETRTSVLEEIDGKNHVLGEQAGVRVSFSDGTSMDHALMLFFVANGGITQVGVQDAPEYRFTLGKEHLPSANVYAAVVRDGVVYTSYFSAFIQMDSEPYQLQVRVKPDRTQYQVRDRVEADVVVQDSKGNPVESRVNIRVMDKSYLSIDDQATQENPLSDYWFLGFARWNGLLINQATHQQYFGADGMGGGGGDVRGNFNEMAYYSVLSTGKDGKAHIAFDLPDNLTTWSILATAADGDWHGGRGQADVIVTQALRVQPVLNDSYLADDVIAISAQAFAPSMKQSDKVAFRFYGPLPADQVKEMNVRAFGAPAKTETVTLNKRPVYEIGKLSPGDYVVAVSAAVGTDEDIVMKTLHVVSARSTKRTVETYDASSGWQAPDLQLTGRATVYLGSESLSQAYKALAGTCLCTTNLRLDHIAAVQRAAELLRQYYGQEITIPLDGVAYEYKVPTGGFALYPFGAADLKTSSLAMSVLTDAKERLSDAPVYFGSFLNNKDATPEEVALAFRGLAALQEPGLASLQAFAKRDDLSTPTKLIVIDALLEYGDQTTARALWSGLAGSIQRDQNMAWISADKANEDQKQEWTEYALVIAAKLHDPVHADFYRYLHRQTPLRVQPIQEVRYWQELLQQQPQTEWRALVSVEGKTEFISAPGYQVRALSLTPDQFKTLSISQVQGPVSVIVTYEEPSRETTLSDAISVTRVYKQNGKAVTTIDPDLPVTVEVAVKLTDGKYAGRYAVEDVLPSGLKALVHGTGWDADYSRCDSSPFTSSEQRVSALVWLGSNCSTVTLKYRARAAAERGTYIAEPSVVTGVQYPDVRVTTPVTSVTMK